MAATPKGDLIRVIQQLREAAIGVNDPATLRTLHQIEAMIDLAGELLDSLVFEEPGPGVRKREGGERWASR